MGPESVVIPASFFWPLAIMALGVVFAAGGVFWQVRTFGNRLTVNDVRWFEHVQGHAPSIAGGSNGEKPDLRG